MLGTHPEDLIKVYDSSLWRCSGRGRMRLSAPRACGQTGRGQPAASIKENNYMHFLVDSGT